jgi:hypothetical protein
MVDVCVALDLLLPLLSNTIYETGATSLNAKPFRWTRTAAEIKRSLDIVTAIYEIRH